MCGTELTRSLCSAWNTQSDSAHEWLVRFPQQRPTRSHWMDISDPLWHSSTFPLFFFSFSRHSLTRKLTERQTPVHFPNGSSLKNIRVSVRNFISKEKDGAPVGPVACNRYWRRPMNGDLEVGGAMSSFGPSCVRKAGRSESRSAASRQFYLLVRLSGTGFLCSTWGSRLRCRLWVTAAWLRCTHCPAGGLSALIQHDLCFLTCSAPNTGGADVFLIIFTNQF